MDALRLEAAGVVKDFPGTRALDHVSFAVAPGEVHALVGENGAGKSTLVKVLSGVCPATAGTLTVDGAQVRFAGPQDAQRAGISTVHQETNLVPQMSVARNLLLGREPRKHRLIDTAAMTARAAETLARFGLGLDVRRPLASLGTSTRQLVAAARAVAADARIVVLDEPTTGLEPADGERLFAVVDELRAEGRSVVYVTHRLQEVERICDRVTVLRGGRVVHTGTVATTDHRRLVSLMLGRPVVASVTALGGPAAQPADTPVLRATGLTRRRVLADVSVDLREGEVLGLGGLLGAGRSETARAIAGVLPLDAGEVTVLGTTLRGRSISGAIRAGVSLLPEDRGADGIIASLSVRDNIVLAALPRLSRAGIVSTARLDRVVETFMTRLRIKATGPHQLVGELSGGSQQKVLLARWLAMNPRVLMLDEPTRGIDIGAKAEVHALIDDLAVDGLAVMLISSDVEELVASCDRVVVLRDGAVARELNGPDVTTDGIMSVLAAS